MGTLTTTPPSPPLPRSPTTLSTMTAAQIKPRAPNMALSTTPSLLTPSPVSDFPSILTLHTTNQDARGTSTETAIGMSVMNKEESRKTSM